MEASAAHASPSQSTEDVKPEDVAGSFDSIDARPDTSPALAPQARTHHHSHGHGHNHSSKTSGKLEDEEEGKGYASDPRLIMAQLVGVAILEFGIVLHSIIIGLTLAVDESFRTLFVVLIFHRKFSPFFTL